MAQVQNKTDAQKLDDALTLVDDLKATIADKDKTIAQQKAQIDTLRQAASTQKLPAEVEKDVRERVAAGLPRDVAVECALRQQKRNEELAAQEQ